MTMTSKKHVEEIDQKFRALASCFDALLTVLDRRLEKGWEAKVSDEVKAELRRRNGNPPGNGQR